MRLLDLLPTVMDLVDIDSRKWRFADGTYVVPVALRIDFFYESASQAQFEAAADFMAANNLHLMDTRLQDQFTSTMQVFDDASKDYYINNKYAKVINSTEHPDIVHRSIPTPQDILKARPTKRTVKQKQTKSK